MNSVSPRKRSLSTRAGEIPRIRGRKLQTIRQQHFDKEPLCMGCKANGRVTAATELDHIVALSNGGKDQASNRQGLCGTCHEAKTRQDMGWSEKRTIGADGWPVDA